MITTKISHVGILDSGRLLFISEMRLFAGERTTESTKSLEFGNTHAHENVPLSPLDQGEGSWGRAVKKKTKKEKK
jgi:hypothetical protein